ncbi:hypothetical protein [Fodinicurvata sediminis]|uniref:hypothetical protein n=1 Tax=Fodinicurvata sediminis TaxID=1121832 RepID=UPI0003B578B9|nr:hypothetical protein [Fodinicurvata sediminis]
MVRVRIPQYEAQARASVTSMPRVSPERFAAAAAAPMQGAQDVMNQVQEFAEQRLESRRKADLVRVESAAARGLTELQLELERESDWRNMEQRWEEGVQGLREQILEDTDDPAVREAFEQSYQRLALDKEVNVRRKAFKMEVDDAKATLDNTLPEYARLAASAENQAERTELLARGRTAIGEMAEAGYITQQEAVARERDLLGQVDTADVLNAIREDPDHAVDLLIDPNNYRNLGEEQRARLLDRADRRAEARQRSALAAQEKRQRQEEAAARRRREDRAFEMFQTISTADDPTLLGEELEEAARKREISFSDYRLLRSTLEDESAPEDDEGLVLAIEDIILRETRAPEEVHEMILEGRQDGRLTDDTVRRLWDKNRQISRQESIYSSHDYSRAVDFIERHIVTTGPGSTFVRGDEQRRLARAMAELDRRLEAGEELPAIREDIVERYGTETTSTLDLPRPRRAPNGVESLEDVEAARAATADAHDAGELAVDRFEQEMELLDEYERRLRAQMRQQQQMNQDGDRSR